MNSVDVFPSDATETVDIDGDGVGYNADVFPSDATETVDTDGDGVGDNADVFPSVQQSGSELKAGTHIIRVACHCIHHLHSA